MDFEESINSFVMNKRSRGQHLKQHNVERPILQNFEISNINRTKDKLFDFFIFEFIFYFYIRLIDTSNI